MPSRRASFPRAKASASPRLDELTRARASAREHVGRAIRIGVPIAVGTDATVYPHGLNARELGVLVELGVAPLEAIRAATVYAARLLGLEREAGSLQPGMRGDLIAVIGDPLQDVRVLEHVAFVMKDGDVAKDEIAGSQVR